MARTLILGTDGAVGAYLARLLDARGLALATMVGDTGGDAAADASHALGIADSIDGIAAADLAGEIAAGAFPVIHAIAAADAARLAAIDSAIAAMAVAATPARLCLTVDRDLLAASPAVRDQVRRVVALRRDHGHFAGTAILHAHDSRLGPGDSLSACITGTAFRLSKGEVLPPLDLVETGPRDWGWTPEYVDAISRLPAQAAAADFAIGSGHALSVADFTAHAFEFFGLDPQPHVRITTGSAAASDTIDRAALKARIGWSASTFGRDLVRALCEGAGDRAAG